MKIFQLFKREIQSLGMSRKESAFVLTLLLMLILVVAFIFVKVNNRTQEIWIEIPPKEELTELLKEEELTPKEDIEPEAVTTRAYNQSDASIRHSEDFKTLDELLSQNMQNQQEASPQQEEEGIEEKPKETSPKKIDDGLSFKELEKYKQNTSATKTANKRTLISYFLQGREAITELPNPVYTCEESGKVVINITVDAQGYVIQAKYNKSSSSTSNGCLVDNAIYYAQKARFDTGDKPKQTGTITYQFQ